MVPNLLKPQQWRYTALPRNAYDAANPYLQSGRRRGIAVGGVALVALCSLILFFSNTRLAREPQVYAANADMWGVHEQAGWVQTADGVKELPDAEARFRYGIGAGDAGIEQYFFMLDEFARSLPAPLHAGLLSELTARLPPSHSRLLSGPPARHRQLPGMVSYKHIFQTDKTDVLNDESKLWRSMNARDGWEYRFFNDSGAEAWTEKHFGSSQVAWAWREMKRGVLKADFLRYLLPLVEGGVYSDVDTRPVRPIEQWGHLNVETLNLASTDGGDWTKKQATQPAVVVAVDVDVHARMNWAKSWPRALGICQWTLSSAPNHPIFLDAARRVVNNTRVVGKFIEDKDAKVAALRAKGKQRDADKLAKKPLADFMPVVEWTGPGMFTDAVFAYLLARYNVTWTRLRALDHPLRIGDVLILPITAFSPGGATDFKSGSRDDPQCNVIHNFRASWKHDGW